MELLLAGKLPKAKMEFLFLPIREIIPIGRILLKVFWFGWWQDTFNLYPFVGNIVSTSSLEDIKPIVYVYPNPFTEVLNIEVQLEKPNALEVEIIDALGRVLRVAKSSNVTDKHALQIQNLDYTGILFVKVKSEGKYALVKVVKNN